MNKLKVLCRKHRVLLLYLAFGVLTTLVNMVVLQGLEFFLKPRWGDHSYMFSLVVAFIVSLVFAFVVNKLFVFEKKTWKLRLVLYEAWTFSAARLISFIFMEFIAVTIAFDLIWPKVEPRFAPWWAGLKLPIKIMPIDAYRFLVRWCVVAVLVVILNYFFSKWVVFKKTKEEPQK